MINGIGGIAAKQAAREKEPVCTIHRRDDPNDCGEEFVGDPLCDHCTEGASVAVVYHRHIRPHRGRERFCGGCWTEFRSAVWPEAAALVCCREGMWTGGEHHEPDCVGALP